MSLAVSEVRRALGWRYRRGLAFLLFLVPVLAFLFAAHRTPSWHRFVFEFEVENRRVISVADHAASRAFAESSVRRDRPFGGCWLEVSGARLGRMDEGRVKLASLDAQGRLAPLAVDEAEARRATMQMPMCWFELADGRLATRDGERILLLESLRTGAWGRGFLPFAVLLGVFSLGGLLVGLVLRRPARAEVTLASMVAAGLEARSMLNAIGGDVAVLREELFMRDPLGFDYAGLAGFAPWTYLAALVPAAALCAGFVVVVHDELGSLHRCRACLATAPLPVERGSACARCGTVDRESKIEWLVVSAVALAAGLLLGVLFHFGGELGIFEACSATKPTALAREAMNDTSGFFGWSAYARRSLWEGDPGRIVAFRPARYLALVSPLFILLPALLGARLRDGFRTTMATLPALLATSLVVSSSVVAGSQPYFYMVLLRWHFAGLVIFGVLGFASTVLGVRWRQSKSGTMLEDLGLEDVPAEAVAAPPLAADPAGPASSGRVDAALADLPDSVAAALKPSFVARHRKKLLAFFFALLLTGVGWVVRAFLPTPEERFVGSAFGRALSTHLFAFSRDPKSSKGVAAREEILGDRVAKELGPEALSDLRATLDAVERFEKSEVGRKDLEELHGPLDALDTKLAAARIPGHVGVFAQPTGASLLGYYVHSRSELRVDGGMHRVVRGRRLDNAALADQVAWKSEFGEWVVVSLDAIEEDFLERELPRIVKDGPRTDDELEAGPADLRGELLAKVGAAIASELSGASRFTRTRASEVVELLARRADGLENLKKLGYTVPTGLSTFPVWALETMEKNRSEPVTADLLRMDERLRSYRAELDSALEIVAELAEEEYVVAWLEQKRLEGASSAPLASARLDAAETRGVVSAELAKLARKQRCPSLALWRTVRRAWGASQQTLGARSATRFVVAAVSKELGLGEESAPDAAAREVAALFAKPSAEIEAAAARAYQATFGKPPPELVRTTSRSP